MPTITLVAVAVDQEFILAAIEKHGVSRICIPTLFWGRYVPVTRDALDFFFYGRNTVETEIYDMTIIQETVYIDPADTVMDNGKLVDIATDEFPF